jgi:hypothetical protein
MLKSILMASTALILAVAPAAAQSQSGNVPPTKAECDRNSAAPGCTQVQSPGTGSGRDNSTVSPGPGSGGSAAGAGKAGGVNPQGNPASSGGSPQGQ